jgi:hypothetical protein
LGAAPKESARKRKLDATDDAEHTSSSLSGRVLRTRQAPKAAEPAPSATVAKARASSLKPKAQQKPSPASVTNGGVNKKTQAKKPAAKKATKSASIAGAYSLETSLDGGWDLYDDHESTIELVLNGDTVGEPTTSACSMAS